MFSREGERRSSSELTQRTGRELTYFFSIIVHGLMAYCWPKLEMVNFKYLFILSYILYSLVITSASVFIPSDHIPSLQYINAIAKCSCILSFCLKCYIFVKQIKMPNNNPQFIRGALSIKPRQNHQHEGFEANNMFHIKTSQIWGIW